MANEMMQPAMWANGVQQPNYAQELMDFSMLPKIGEKIGQGAKQKPAGNGPLQLTPGPNQGKPTGIGTNMNSMANTANALPMAQALMRMLGGGSQAMAMAQPEPSQGTIGGVNPFPGMSPLY